MTYPTISSKHLAAAAAQLARDPILKPLVGRYGTCTIEPHRNYYQAIVSSIISQQLSVKAADTIEARFIHLFGDTFPAPIDILSISIEQLRSVGLSGQKASYIKDLAQHIVDGEVIFDHLDNLSNDEIITELTAVKGIGIWTVHMFLMFCMGRMDVLATGDLGIRNGIMKLYNLETIPSPVEVEEVATRNHWHPFESVACWYIWQSLDNKPATS